MDFTAIPARLVHRGRGHLRYRRGLPMNEQVQELAATNCAGLTVGQFMAAIRQELPPAYPVPVPANASPLQHAAIADHNGELFHEAMQRAKERLGG